MLIPRPDAFVLQLGKWEDAQRDCSRAVDLDENYLKAYTRRAEVYRKLGKFDEAVRDLTKAHEMDGENAGAILGRWLSGLSTH